MDWILRLNVFFSQKYFNSKDGRAEHITFNTEEGAREKEPADTDVLL